MAARKKAAKGVATIRNGRRRPNRVRVRSDIVLTTGLIHMLRMPLNVPV